MELVGAKHSLNKGEDALRGGGAREHGEDKARRICPLRELGLVVLPPVEDVGRRAPVRIILP